MIGAAGTESNLRPLPYRGRALPTELRRRNGGTGRDRTGDILVAGQVLSQLSYSPVIGPHRWLRSTGLSVPGRALCQAELCAEWVSCGATLIVSGPAQMLRKDVRPDILEMAQPGAGNHPTGAPLGHGGLRNTEESRGGRSAPEGICDNDCVVHTL